MSSASTSSRFDPDFTKVLVRYNPDGDARRERRAAAQAQGPRATGCTQNDRKFLFELLVPAEEAQLDAVGGDTERYDAELRPELMRRAIAEIQDFGIEVDIWKIEGVDERSDCEMLVEQARAAAATASSAWSSAAAPTTPRSTSGSPPPPPSTGSSASRSAARSGGTRSRPTSTARSSAPTGARKIAENYLRFVSVYERATKAAAAS